ncbi:MAG TPA: TIGR04211 family SH3 domain-containing protein [Steroidobacteraceae bacterium]|nr:TIGR04211 family SH3 domain-containing protein [Steroidobacteraceae bacterium]
MSGRAQRRPAPSPWALRPLQLARCATLGIAAVLAVAAAARAGEMRYVSDTLIVGLTANADGTGERVATVRSGDTLEVLEQQDERTHVRLGSGEEGWIKTSYLSSDPPLRQQLTARTQELAERVHELEVRAQELEITRQQLAHAQAQLAQQQGRAGSEGPSTPAAAAPSVAAMRVATEGNPPERAAAPWFDNPAASSPGAPWGWLLAGVLLGGLAGAALGWRLLDRRIRKRYGGLKIY